MKAQTYIDDCNDYRPAVRLNEWEINLILDNLSTYPDALIQDLTAKLSEAKSMAEKYNKSKQLD